MEKTFQLLSQVSGRAGREKFAGSVYLQTYYSDSKLMKLLQTNNYDEFIDEEISERSLGFMPPFSRMASIIVASASDEIAKSTSKDLARKRLMIDNLQVLGPAPANISRINKKYRYRFIIIAPRTFNIQSYISKWLTLVKIKSTVNIIVDIDPYNLM
jgi:primosomal protein N' (replication factor Y)